MEIAVFSLSMPCYNYKIKNNPQILLAMRVNIIMHGKQNINVECFRLIPFFNLSTELIVIRKPLQPCTFTNSKNSILLRMYIGLNISIISESSTAKQNSKIDDVCHMFRADIYLPGSEGQVWLKQLALSRPTIDVQMVYILVSS